MFQRKKVKKLQKENEQLLEDKNFYESRVKELERANWRLREKIYIIERDASDRDWEYKILRTDYEALKFAHKELLKQSPTTFDVIEVGDLVRRVDKHSADIRVVEGVIKNEGENNNVLLANSRRDIFYEGQDEIDRFNMEWKLLCKADNLIK